jgi:hypothetical protein
MFPKKGFGINFGGTKPGPAKVKAANLPPKKQPEYETEDGENTYESDRNEELAHVLKEFKESAKQENERRDDYVDNEFYASIVFTNKEQRNAFFKAIGVDCTPTTDLRFINGIMLAKNLGIELPNNSALPPAKFKQAKAVLALTQLPKPRPIAEDVKVKLQRKK